MGEPNLLQLFGDSPVEPFKTFQNLFRDRYEVPYSLGGIVLAYVYRAEALRGS
jgi:hypothetical protein